MSPRDQDPAEQSLPAFVDWIADRYGEAPALLYKPGLKNEVTTYRDIKEGAEQIASWLMGRGISSGDRVVLWGPNNPDWVMSFFGILKAGAVAVPLDVRCAPDFARRVMEQSQPSLALVMPSLSGDWSFNTPFVSLEDVRPLARTAPKLDMPAVSSESLAEIVFTSGTTGNPKGVMLTHRNIRSNVEAVNQIMPCGPSYRPLSILPLSHLLEQTCGLLLALRGGTSIAYATAIQPAAILRDMQEYRVTTMVVVPRVLSLFLASIERRVQEQGKQRLWDMLMRVSVHLPMRLRRVLFRDVIRSFGGRIRFFVVGGAPLDPGLERKWELMGIPILQGYGSTETSPIVAGTSLEDRMPRSVGRAIPGVNIRLDADGEILVQGPNVMAGYWRNAEATSACLVDGWYHTGDLGEIDAGGRLFLKGRKKNMIVLANGLNVFPEDVEEALRGVAGVVEPVVVAVPSSFGPQIHAVLLCSKDAPPVNEIVRLGNADLAPHQQIRSWSVWPHADFPRTHTAKVKRQEVLDYVLEEQRGRPAVSRPRSESALAKKYDLRDLVAGVAGAARERVRAESTVEELELSGAALMRLGRAVEDRLGKHLDVSRMGQTTVSDLEPLLLSGNPSGEHPYPLWPFSHRIRALRALLQAPIIAAIRAIARPRVSGFPETGSRPMVFVARYDTLLVAPFVLSVLPDSIRRRTGLSASWKDNRRGRVARFVVALVFNSFRYSRTGSPHATLVHAAGLLNHGWSVLFLVRDESGSIPKDVALLADELDCPVVRITTSGLAHGRRLPFFRGVTIRFEPVPEGSLDVFEDAEAAVWPDPGARDSEEAATSHDTALASRVS